MPTYTYQCKSGCEVITTEFKRISEYNKICPKCQSCGGETSRVILGAPAIATQSSIGYKCVATGETITSHTQRKEVMRRHDLVDAA